MKTSAGLLLWRRDASGELRVLLVHPSGAYNRRAPWGIPKGELDSGETAEACALRETMEETGVVVSGALVALGSIDYTKSRKRVHAFAAELPAEAAPRCASWEIDGAELVTVTEARRRIHADQAAFLERLERVLAGAPVT